MKATVSKETVSVRIPPAIALKHPSYQNPAIQAAAALNHLSEQYKLKAKKENKKAGHA